MIYNKWYEKYKPRGAICIKTTNDVGISLSKVFAKAIDILRAKAEVIASIAALILGFRCI
jgi:hypothetical protein